LGAGPKIVVHAGPADAQLALPAVLLAIIVVAVLGANTVNLVLVLALTSWVVYARMRPFGR